MPKDSVKNTKDYPGTPWTKKIKKDIQEKKENGKRLQIPQTLV